MDLDRLRKVYALTDSPNPHEAAAALEKVKALLAAEGKGMRDLPALLAEPATSAPPPWASYAPMNQDTERALRDILREARAGIRPGGPVNPQVAFLYANLVHLTGGEKTSLMGISMVRTTLTRRQQTTVNYLIERVRTRKAAGTAVGKAAHV